MNALDFTHGKPTIKTQGRPKKEDAPSRRKEYHANWLKSNPDKVKKYRLQAMIKCRNLAIDRMQKEIQDCEDALSEITRKPRITINDKLATVQLSDERSSDGDSESN